MKLRKPIYLLLLASVTAWLTACSSGSSSTPPPSTPISITLSAPASLLQGSTASLTAVVSNDSKSAGVKWSVTCGSSTCGSFSPIGTASGAATTYTAPATAATLNVTVIATSVTDSTKSASATITITTTAQPISVSFDPQPPASVANGATANLTAVVSNDSKNAGVTWSATCGSPQCGSFNPANTASGSATTYTAPPTPPTPNTVKVTATSVTDPTKSVTATITIATPPAVIADGTYVFHLSGYDLDQQNGPAPYFVAGTFMVKGGAIAGGEQDFIDYYNGGFTNSISASGSGLTNVGGNIQVVLNTGNNQIGANGVEIIRGAVVSSSRVLISEFDTAASGTGSIDLQTSTAAPSGGYVFNLLGLDGTQNGNPLAIGGVLNIAGNSINVGGGMSIFDLNDGDGTIGQAQSFAAGSVTAPDSYGRITFTLTPATVTPEFPNVILVGYIVGANRIQLVEGQNDLLNGSLGGTALGQGTNTGKFSQASVLNTGYVFLANGEDANNGIAQLAGGFVFNPAGALTGDLVINDLGCCGGTSITGNYAIDSTGRVTISNVTPTLIENVPFVFQLYLDGNGNALELGMDESQLSAGPAFLQNAPSSSYAGTFAVSAQGYGNFESGLVPWSATGSTTISSNTFNGFTDFNTLGTQLNSNVALTGTSSTTEPVFTLTGLNAANPGTSNNYGIYPIDSARVLAIEVDKNATNTQLGILLLEGTPNPN